LAIHGLAHRVIDLAESVAECSGVLRTMKAHAVEDLAVSVLSIADASPSRATQLAETTEPAGT